MSPIFRRSCSRANGGRRIKSSRSRCARRASSSASLGTGTIEQTRGSPRSHAINVRKSISTSITSVLARRARRSTGRLDDCIVDMNLFHPAPLQKARKPKSVASSLMRHDHPRNRLSRPRLNATSAVSINSASAGPFGSTTCRECFFHARKLDGEHPFLRTQLQSADHRAIVIESGGRKRRIPQSVACRVPFGSSKQTNRIPNPRPLLAPIGSGGKAGQSHLAVCDRVGAEKSAPDGAPLRLVSHLWAFLFAA